MHDIFVAAVHRQLVAAARARDCGLEPGVGGDKVIRENASVAPAAHPQPVRVGNLFADRIVHGPEQIGHLPVAPVRDDAAGERTAPPAAAAIVDRQHHVPMSRKPLTLELQWIGVHHQSMGVLPVGPAVNPQDGGIQPAGLIVGRLHDHSVDGGAVAARKGNILHRSERQLREHGVVVRGELAQTAVLESLDLGHRAVGGGDHRDMASPGAETRRRQLAADPPLHLSRIEPHRDRNLGAVVLQDEIHGVTLRRHRRIRHRTIQPLGEHSHLAVGHGDHVQPILNVGIEPRLETRGVDEPRAIRSPCKRRLVRGKELRELARRVR